MTQREHPFVIEIDHVQIAAPRGCENAARNFFGDLLGLVEIEKPEALRSRGGCWFRAGPRQLHVGVEDDFSAAKKAHPAFATLDVCALSERLERAGVHVTWDASVSGLHRFYVMDPWGNRIEFTEPTYAL